jgi:hypothetical protein
MFGLISCRTLRVNERISRGQVGEPPNGFNLRAHASKPQALNQRLPREPARVLIRELTGRVLVKFRDAEKKTDSYRIAHVQLGGCFFDGSSPE